ncbi:MAG: type II toxin-antitoxin system HicB family antitoxin [Magnetococcus sp. YQC-3]
MLLNYLQTALRHAHYEILLDDNSFYGEIPACNGVYANASTLEACRDELAEVLEEWVLFRIHKNLALPAIAAANPGTPDIFSP